MIASLRPKYVWWATGLYTAVFLAWRVLAEPSAEMSRMMFRASSFGSLCWYVVAALLAWQICRTHARGSAMRRAWALMAGSAAFAVCRHIFQVFGWYVGGWDEPQIHWMSGFRQVPIALSLLLLIASLITMWRAFHKVGLGVRFRAMDIALLLLGLALIPVIVTNYTNIRDANALLGLARALQYATPFLIVVSAAMGVILYRISEGMGGGELSKCLRALTAFLLLRLAGHLLFTFPWGTWRPVAEILGRVVWSSIDGVFLLALAYRWQIARLADEAVLRDDAQEAAATSQAGAPA